MSESVVQLISELKYDFGMKVYPVVGEQEPGIITAYTLRPGHILYSVSWSPGKESSHYDFELSVEKKSEVTV